MKLVWIALARVICLLAFAVAAVVCVGVAVRLLKLIAVIITDKRFEWG